MTLKSLCPLLSKAVSATDTATPFRVMPSTYKLRSPMPESHLSFTKLIETWCAPGVRLAAKLNACDAPDPCSVVTDCAAPICWPSTLTVNCASPS